MSKEDFMIYANKRIVAREQSKVIGEREARNHAFETSRRINRRLYSEKKRRNYKW